MRSDGLLHHDKEVRLREFEVGDTVLVLLPTSTSKLLVRWQGPYQITKLVGLLNYHMHLWTCMTEGRDLESFTSTC